MDGIKTVFLFLHRFGLMRLNNSLNGIDIRYTAANGAEWSPRGAGTWSPFSGTIKALVMYDKSPEQCILIDENGTITTGTTLSALLSDSDLFRATYSTDGRYGWETVTLLKDGYYAWIGHGSGSIPTYKAAGSTLQFITSFQYSGDLYQFAVAYCGTANPNP